jgi:hypothetical protein
MSRSQRPGSGVVPGGRLGVQKGANSTRAATFCAHRKQCPPCARASTHLFSGGTKCATEGGVGALYTRIMCVCAVCRLASRLASRLVACRVIFLNILRPCPGFARVVSERMSSLRVHTSVYNFMRCDDVLGGVDRIDRCEGSVGPRSPTHLLTLATDSRNWEAGEVTL